MQYTTIFAAALAATGALAAPSVGRRTDNSIRIQLSGASELATQTPFEENKLPQAQRPVGSSGPYRTVELSLGPAVKKQDLRCQILDKKNNPIVITRGPNVDITFADGDGGEWKIRDGEVEVSKIICDPSFKKGEAPPPEEDDDEDKDLDITVILSKNGNKKTEVEFTKAGEKVEKHRPSKNGPFNTVELSVGDDVKNQGLRCQILDKHTGNPITVKRGENIDTTFADGGNGPWSFLEPEKAKVGKVICDPSFVKASA